MTGTHAYMLTVLLAPSRSVPRLLPFRRGGHVVPAQVEAVGWRERLRTGGGGGGIEKDEASDRVRQAQRRQHDGTRRSVKKQTSVEEVA